jgi:acetylornithine aminotransferase/acetylornithine/N-succinyldiaminopimelate aminotransferase
MSAAQIIEKYQKFVVPTYARFPLVIERGKGGRVWDSEGKEYLDFGSGIAVCSLGHAHPAIVDCLTVQASKLLHTSNLYFSEPQALLAEKIASAVGVGKSFFCNSGAEANEALFKLARRWGQESGRYEILTTFQSFHGRTLAGISATGQEKVKKGFDPLVPGFRHVPFNDLVAMRSAVSEQTIAILIEGIQGESGVYPASSDYLLGLRQLCDEKKMLLMMDSIQCGMYRTGRFQSYQRILENAAKTSDFLPDAISMAKGLGGGLPIGAVWIRGPYSELLGPGSHGTTFGGNPLVCAVALTVMNVIEREQLAQRTRELGEYLKSKLQSLQSPWIQEIRGIGLMIGVELKQDLGSLKVEGRMPSSVMVSKLCEEGLLLIPSGAQTLRLLPSLNVTRSECDEAIEKLQRGLQKLE